MDPKLQEKIDRLSEMTDEELDAFENDLVVEFERIDGEATTPANVAVLTEINEAHDKVLGEQTTRAEASATAEAEAQKLRDKMKKPEAVAPEIPEVPEVEETPEVEEVPEVEETPEAIAAAAAKASTPKRPSPAKFNSKAPQVRPNDNGQSAKTTITALINGTGNTRGRAEQLESRDELAQLMTHAVNALGRGSGDPIYVARIDVEYPEERRLTGDPITDGAKVDAVVGRQALVASGGVCNPVAVDYSLFVKSSDAEPIAAALENFQATRGGVRFMQTPTFTGVGGSGTTIWTEATDASPGTATKPVQTITCGNEIEVYVDAIPTRLKFGNMSTRFFPELVDANTTLAESNAARIRELYRLSKISASSTVVSSGQLLGAARDILATADQAAAAYCYRSRLDRDSTQLRALFPSWAKDMFRADMARTYAADPENVLAITDAQINAWFSARGINATWFMDGQPAVTGAPAYALQGFGTQSTPNVLLDWPHTLVWYMFVEGSFQRLDGGQLNIGVVRDSVLDNTNDYETFIETFEGIAFRGFESLQIVSTVRPNGAYAGAVTTATSPNVY
jgi:hypothetical protein